MVTLSLLLMASGLTPVIPQTDPDHIALRVRVYADRRVDKRTLRRAQGVSQRLARRGRARHQLAHLCTTAAPCQLEDSLFPRSSSSSRRRTARMDAQTAAVRRFEYSDLAHGTADQPNESGAVTRFHARPARAVRRPPARTVIGWAVCSAGTLKRPSLGSTPR
jgi:hypothetical protein